MVFLKNQTCQRPPQFNVRVLLLEPDAELLTCLMQETHPDRDFFHRDGMMAASEVSYQWWQVVQYVFGQPWNPLPEEDLLPRAYSKLRPLKRSQASCAAQTEQKRDAQANNKGPQPARHM